MFSVNCVQLMKWWVSQIDHADTNNEFCGNLMVEKPWFGCFLNWMVLRPMARLDSAAFSLDKIKNWTHMVT